MKNKPTILIIDDEPFYVKILAECLSSKYNIIIACNAQQVLLRLKATIPDLILLDILMPEVGGYEICEELKKSHEYKHIPVIFISTLGKVEDEVRGLELGAVDFLSKPFRLPLVQLRVKNHLKLQQQSKLLKQLAHEDPLTKIPNRRRFDEFLTREWLISARYQSNLSLLMIDIDLFKQYNDRYGHLQGDQCLIKVAETLSSLVMRRTDLLCRYGGEEFAVILPDSTPEIAQQIAEKLRSGIADLQLPHVGSKLYEHVTISIGVATMVASNESQSESLLEKADGNLYRAKKAGRNQIASHD